MHLLASYGLAEDLRLTALSHCDIREKQVFVRCAMGCRITSFSLKFFLIRTMMGTLGDLARGCPLALALSMQGRGLTPTPCH